MKQHSLFLAGIQVNPTSSRVSFSDLSQTGITNNLGIFIHSSRGLHKEDIDYKEYFCSEVMVKVEKLINKSRKPLKGGCFQVVVTE